MGETLHLLDKEQIEVYTLRELYETIERLESQICTWEGKKGGEIRFNGSARVGVWQQTYSDIGDLTTYFKGNLVLEMFGWHRHVGCIPDTHYYRIRSFNHPEIHSELRYIKNDTYSLSLNKL